MKQFFRKLILDFSSDTNLFDLKAREFSSILLEQSFQFSLISLFSSSSLFSHYVRKKHQNDLFIRDNAIEKLFRVSKITRKNEKSTDFHESLTLRRDRKRRFDLNRHFEESSQNSNKEFQDNRDNEKSIEMQRQKSFQKRNQCKKCVKNSEKLVQLVRIKNVK